MLQTEVGAADLDIDQEGNECPETGTYLLVGSAIGHAIWVKEMGPDAAYEEGVVCIPPQGGPQADGEATTEGTGQRLGLSPAGGCDCRGGFVVGGDLRLPHPEHSRAVYCD